jgi:hypothetical protein
MLHDDMYSPMTGATGWCHQHTPLNGQQNSMVSNHSLEPIWQWEEPLNGGAAATVRLVVLQQQRGCNVQL